jgi:hypothetical protein
MAACLSDLRLREVLVANTSPLPGQAGSHEVSWTHDGARRLGVFTTVIGRMFSAQQSPGIPIPNLSRDALRPHPLCGAGYAGGLYGGLAYSTSYVTGREERGSELSHTVSSSHPRPQ